MRRQDIQLLAAARQGSPAACCEVGRRYLLGSDGFPRHPGSGLGYLMQPEVRGLPCSALAIAESLPLHEILALDQLAALQRAARSGSDVAQLKLGAWLLTQPRRLNEGLQCLHASADAGDPSALAVLSLDPQGRPTEERVAAMLERLGEQQSIDAPRVLARALADAQEACDGATLRWCLAVVARWRRARCPEAAAAVVDALQLAEHGNLVFDGMPVEFVMSSLDQRGAQGDVRALYLFGRLLCGIPCGRLAANAIACGTNIRKGTALLLRAADAGEAGAWMHLYRLSSDHRCSVANPQMARFFLEKAAVQDSAEAQRKLGALLLRESDGLAITEKALRWLHRSSEQGDELARLLLRSLVLPVMGDDAEAAVACELIARTNPWLASRLRLSRHFGLTRLEALAMDPGAGARPWGLVVGPNRFVRKARLAAPRAVPAVSEAARHALRAAAQLFSLPDRDDDPRQRARALRTLSRRHGIDESIFFAVATAGALHRLRSGPKWAFRARDVLRSALRMPARA